MNTAKYGVGADFGFRPATEQEQAEAYVKEQRPALMETSRVGITAMYNYEINLQDWLAVLEDAKPGNSYVFQHGSLVYKPENKIVMDFNLTTGQPATEADYASFCAIMKL